MPLGITRAGVGTTVTSAEIGPGEVGTTDLADNAVTHAKYQDIATDRLLGRDTAATGDPEALTVGGGIEFTGSTGIQTSAFTGDVTKAAGGTATTIATDSVTADKILAAAVGTSEAPTFVNSTVENMKVLRGIIDTAGSGTIVEGTGFTIVRNGTGDLTITFTAAFSDVPALSFTGGGTTSIRHVLVFDGTSAAAGSVRVGVLNNLFALADGVFHFIAIGPR